MATSISISEVESIRAIEAAKFTNAHILGKHTWYFDSINDLFPNFTHDPVKLLYQYGDDKAKQFLAEAASILDGIIPAVLLIHPSKSYLRKYVAAHGLHMLLFLSLLADIGVAVSALGKKTTKIDERDVIVFKFGRKNGLYIASVLAGLALQGTYINNDVIGSFIKTLADAAATVKKMKLNEEYRKLLDEYDAEYLRQKIELEVMDEKQDFIEEISRFLKSLTRGGVWTNEKATKIAIPVETLDYVKQFYQKLDEVIGELRKYAKTNDEAEKVRKDLEWMLTVGFELFLALPHIKRRKEGLAKWQTSPLPLIAYWAKKLQLKNLLSIIRYAYKRLVKNRDEIRKLLIDDDLGHKVLRDLDPFAFRSLSRRAYARLKAIQKHIGKLAVGFAFESAVTAARLASKSFLEHKIPPQSWHTTPKIYDGRPGYLPVVAAYISAFLTDGNPLPFVYVDDRALDPVKGCLSLDDVRKKVRTPWEALKETFPGIEEVVKQAEKGALPKYPRVKSMLAPPVNTAKTSGYRILYISPRNYRYYRNTGKPPEVSASQGLGGYIAKLYYKWLRGEITLDDLAEEWLRIMLERMKFDERNSREKTAIIRAIAAISRPSMPYPIIIPRPADMKRHEAVFKRVMEEIDKEQAKSIILNYIITEDKNFNYLACRMAMYMLKNKMYEDEQDKAWLEEKEEEACLVTNITSRKFETMRAMVGHWLFGLLLAKKIREKILEKYVDYT